MMGSANTMLQEAEITAVRRQESSQPCLEKSDMEDVESSGESLSAIDKGLDGYCEKPSPSAFMEIYTCVYNLCNNRDRKQLVCQSVYNKYQQETVLCSQRLHNSMKSLTSAAQSPSSAEAWRAIADESIGEWKRLERRLYALQNSFGYLDRYYVPRAHLASLDSVRMQVLEEADIEEKSREMWASIAMALREGRLRISFQLMSLLQENWMSVQKLLPAASGRVSGSCNEWFSEALREHLVTTFVEGFFPRGVAPLRICPCAATARVLGAQTPLARVILEFLSEQDLAQVYSTQSAERSSEPRM